MTGVEENKRGNGAGEVVTEKQELSWKFGGATETEKNQLCKDIM